MSLIAGVVIAYGSSVLAEYRAVVLGKAARWLVCDTLKVGCDVTKQSYKYMWWRTLSHFSRKFASGGSERSFKESATQ